MFKFNFSNNEPDDSVNTNLLGRVISDAKEIHLNEVDLVQINASNYNHFKCPTGLVIKYLAGDCIISNVKENHHDTIISTVTNHSDLEAGVYEGGLKIWECTQDLINFMCVEGINLKNKTVLDLGCGTGIVGIFSLLQGARLYFQDYNPEVVLSATIPNVFLNVGNVETCLKTSKFYSGDWQSFSVLMKNDNIKFDLILTSETIYNIDNYNKLHGIFTNCLKENGVIYVAAKTYYFGVGGGLRSFEELVTSLDEFNFETRWVCSSGISREIIKLTKKSKSCD